MAGRRPIAGPPSFGRVLVVAPHPDDESLGCGGTIALLAAAGANVAVIIASDGEALTGTGLSKSQIAERRRSEAAEACRTLDVGAPRFLGLPDGRLGSEMNGLTKGIRVAIDEVNPQAIYVPWFLDGHMDHQAVSSAVAACSLRDSTEVWGYEVWTPLPPNRLVDITAVWEKKRAAVEAHKSDPLLDVDGILGLNRYRSAQDLGAGRYAESFLALPARDYFSLMREFSGS